MCLSMFLTTMGMLRSRTLLCSFPSMHRALPIYRKLGHCGHLAINVCFMFLSVEYIGIRERGQSTDVETRTYAREEPLLPLLR